MAISTVLASAQLDAAASAANNMQSVWRSIVSGAESQTAVNSMLADVGSLLGALEDVKTAFQAETGGE